MYHIKGKSDSKKERKKEKDGRKEQNGKGSE